jgi:hypothetical protein
LVYVTVSNYCMDSAMNQRIQQLANQAKLNVPHGIMGVDKWIEAYNQELGQLIVAECAGLCINELADPRDTVEQQCAAKIMAHFRRDPC